MNVQDYRSSFILYFVDSVEKRSDYARDLAAKNGYKCELFKDWIQFKDHAEIHPPHMLLIQYSEKAWNLDEMIREAHEILPETHIFLFASPGQMPKAASYYDKHVYDLIPFPFENPLQLMRSLDRAAELDFQIYRNEQQRPAGSTYVSSVTPKPVSEHTKIKPTVEPPKDASGRRTQPYEVELENSGIFTLPSVDTSDMFPSFSIWLQELNHKKSIEESVEHFAQGVYLHLNKTPSAYFKFFAPRRALIASFGIGLEPLEIRGTGINLNEEETNFRVQNLRDPEGIKAVRDMITEVFKRDSHLCIPLDIQGRILGIFIFFPQVDDFHNNPWFVTTLASLEKNILLLETQKRLHLTGGHDEATETWNRLGFLSALAQEIARARRTQLPVSLIIIKIDQLTVVEETYGREESDLILRMIGKVFRKHSRLNDILGRVGPDELAMLLPNTSQQGAAIKAERLRRTVESADFSKVLKAAPKMTISVGISEYPSLCRDADELMQTADEALFEVCEQGGNLVCLTSRPEGFQADFVVKGEAKNDP